MAELPQARDHTTEMSARMDWPLFELQASHETTQMPQRHARSLAKVQIHITPETTYSKATSTRTAPRCAATKNRPTTPYCRTSDRPAP